MEPILREEVQRFTQACEAFAGFAQENDALTDAERGIVRNCLRVLEQEVAPSPPPPFPDDAPLAATLSNMPLID
jgi:hypothetical protein